VTTTTFPLFGVSDHGPDLIPLDRRTATLGSVPGVAFYGLPVPDIRGNSNSP